MLKFMISWKAAPSFHKPTMESFLKFGAPVPQGSELIGRWHAPGSMYGWVLMDTQDINTVSEHLAQWANLLEFTVPPVIEDDAAGQALSKIYAK